MLSDFSRIIGKHVKNSSELMKIFSELMKISSLTEIYLLGTFVAKLSGYLEKEESIGKTYGLRAFG